MTRDQNSNPNKCSQLQPLFTSMNILFYMHKNTYRLKSGCPGGGNLNPPGGGGPAGGKCPAGGGMLAVGGTTKFPGGPGIGC